MKNEVETYSVQGMTCESCVQRIQERLVGIVGVSSAEVSLKDRLIVLTAGTSVGLGQVREALSDLPKYTITLSTVRPTFLKTYRPLLTLFSLVVLVSIAHQVALGSFNAHLFMSHLMAGFFVGLSFFKLLDISAFALSFSSYDPLAQRWSRYGFIYPLVELALGLLFVAGKAPALANGLTIAILSVTTFGIVRRLRAGSLFQCACLGTVFSLPLSWFTVGENVAMIAMAIYGIVRSSLPG
jgi:copper chaperone CopZ